MKLPCYFSDVGPIIFAEPSKHNRAKKGKKASLKCFFGIRNFLWNSENKGIIREGTWLRNERRVIANDGRVTIKTRAKGKAR